MTLSDCGQHDDKKKLRKKIILGISIALIVVVVIIFIIWVNLKPAKPTFILRDATVYAFNLSAPNLLTSTFQVTIQSRNHNKHIGIYYDRLLVYATYRGEQITLPYSILPTFEDTNAMNLWSPFVTGVSVPVAPFIGAAMDQDRTAGRLLINFKMDGRLKFKVGTIVTSTHRLHVDCPAAIDVGSPNAGVVVANNAIKYQLIKSCTVSV